jgi:23S rRNA (cytidine1920-2'-O)/16S rRNA (cytidine1409-2'-O)-methyltransferase
LDTPLTITEPLSYVSRGGLKLAQALNQFEIAVSGRVALDVGASTGGFTDCLLQRGVSQVFAVDVGRDQLHPRLRRDERIVLFEQTDIRQLSGLPGGVLVDLAVVDVSFISLRLVLAAVLRLVQLDGEVVLLVKPQFEVGPQAVGRGGVVRSAKDRRRALVQVLVYAQELGLHLSGLCPVPPDDSRSNVEYLAHLRRQGPGLLLDQAIDLALDSWV